MRSIEWNESWDLETVINKLNETEYHFAKDLLRLEKADDAKDYAINENKYEYKMINFEKGNFPDEKGKIKKLMEKGYNPVYARFLENYGIVIKPIIYRTLILCRKEKDKNEEYFYNLDNELDKIIQNFNAEINEICPEGGVDLIMTIDDKSICFHMPHIEDGSKKEEKDETDD